MPKGLIVFDVDNDPAKGKDGAISLRRLEYDHGRLPKTVTHTSGGGSPHYFFRTGLDDIRNDKLARDIDVRAGSDETPSLIILTGIHKSGGINHFEHTGDIAQLPAAWEEHLKAKLSKRGVEREAR